MQSGKAAPPRIMEAIARLPHTGLFDDSVVGTAENYPIDWGL